MDILGHELAAERALFPHPVERERVGEDRRVRSHGQRPGAQQAPGPRCLLQLAGHLTDGAVDQGIGFQILQAAD